MNLTNAPKEVLKAMHDLEMEIFDKFIIPGPENMGGYKIDLIGINDVDRYAIYVLNHIFEQKAIADMDLDVPDVSEELEVPAGIKPVGIVQLTFNPEFIYRLRNVIDDVQTRVTEMLFLDEGTMEVPMNSDERPYFIMASRYVQEKFKDAGFKMRRWHLLNTIYFQLEKAKNECDEESKAEEDEYDDQEDEQ